MRTYNHIYSKIVQDENDFIGKIAYSIYKEDKIEYVKNFASSHTEISPTQEELKNFHEISSTETSINRFRLQAETLLQEFLDNTLNEALTEATEEVKSNHILLIREEVEKIKPSGFWNNVLQNVVASIALTAFLALIILIINFTTDGFIKTLANLFGYVATPK